MHPETLQLGLGLSVVSAFTQWYLALLISLWCVPDRGGTGIQVPEKSGKLVSVPISATHLLYIHE